MAAGTLYRQEVVQAAQGRLNRYGISQTLRPGRSNAQRPNFVGFYRGTEQARHSPKAAYAAYDAILTQLMFDPSAGGPATYPKACYATASGSVVLARNIAKAFPATGSGATTMVKRISPSPFTIAASGAVTFSATLVTFIVQQCYAVGSATVAMTKRVTKNFAATGTGAPALTKAVGKVFSAAGTGTTTLVRKVAKTFAITGTAAPTLARNIAKIFAFTGTGTVSYSEAIIFIKQCLSTASGAVTSVQTFIAGGPPPAWFRKMRRAAMTYIRRR